MVGEEREFIGGRQVIDAMASRISFGVELAGSSVVYQRNIWSRSFWPIFSTHLHHMFLDTLPVELIADILAELSLADLIVAAYLSRRLHTVASDPALNPWRKPILRNLCTHNYEPALAHLSVRSIVPRHNWIDILTRARPSFLLFQATLPNLKQSEWEEAFRRRFLPSWAKWKKDAHWKEAYLKSVVCNRLIHPPQSIAGSSTAYGTAVLQAAPQMKLGQSTPPSPDASNSQLIYRIRYMVLNRNGSANQLQTTSRGFDPFVIFDDMKCVLSSSHYPCFELNRSAGFKTT